MDVTMPICQLCYLPVNTHKEHIETNDGNGYKYYHVRCWEKNGGL